MEELFAYALLFCEGYDVWELYMKRLDELFLAFPENEEYLYLEGLKNPKEAALHIVAVMSEVSFDTDLFGRTLMRQIAEIYSTSDIEEFGRKMYSLWNKFPEMIEHQEPFWTFGYADDCLSFGDEEQCRELYEGAMHYYDRENSQCFK